MAGNKVKFIAHRDNQDLVKILTACRIVSLIGGAVGLGSLGEVTLVEAANLGPSPHATYSKCADGHRYTCVVDGDTLWIEGHKIRVADIDAPEISEPKCSSELDLGNRATDRLIKLVNQGPFELQAWPGRDTDRYGRQLRLLVRGGRSLGDILVSEGLARIWTGRREQWC